MSWFSNKPKIPDVWISTALDDGCKGPCYPGSLVSGTITLQSPVERNLELAQACFVGHAITHSRRSEGSGKNSSEIYYRDDANLFMLEQSLSLHTTVQSGQVYSWQFQFEFPHASGIVSSSPYTGDTAVSGIYTNISHSLPPSFGLTRTQNEYAAVEYKVQAMFKFDDIPEPFAVDLQPLNFVPHNPRPQNPRFAEFVKPSQQYSSTRLTGGQKSFGHSFKDKLSSQTPSVRLYMKTTVPQHVTTSGSFPIYACIEMDSFSNPGIDIPVINISLKSLKLCQYTLYRSLKYKGISTRREHQATYEELVHLNAVPEWRQVERQHGKTDERNFIYFPAAFEARIPGATCPSFQTFNINHNFQLEFKLEAEVCEKKFEYKVEVPNVIVYPT